MPIVNRCIFLVHLVLLVSSTAPGCRSTSAQVEDGAPAAVAMACKGDDAHPNCLCDVDADCTSRPGGVCRATPGDIGVDLGIARSCTYPECGVDADCGEGSFCLKPGTVEPVARCIRATCRDDSDCTDRVAGACRLLGIGTTGPWESHCVSADDPCDVDRPCDAAPPNEHGYRAPRACFFVKGAATCVVDEPPP